MMKRLKENRPDIFKKELIRNQIVKEVNSEEEEERSIRISSWDSENSASSSDLKKRISQKQSKRSSKLIQKFYEDTIF
jgi:hypothetical protein